MINFCDPIYFTVMLRCEGHPVSRKEVQRIVTDGVTSAARARDVRWRCRRSPTNAGRGTCSVIATPGRAG